MVSVNGWRDYCGAMWEGTIVEATCGGTIVEATWEGNYNLMLRGHQCL
jgi:hypothetical protein